MRYELLRYLYNENGEIIHNEGKYGEYWRNFR